MHNKLKIILTTFVLLGAFPKNSLSQTIQIVFTSDAHYGITRIKFRGDTAVPSYIVNAALIKQINELPHVMIPADGGIHQNEKVGGIDYVIEGGDIANRMEPPIQSAAASWAQFVKDYIGSLDVKSHDGKPVQLFMVPGNHDISDAIGFAKPMYPLTDPTSMVNIYNMMLKPVRPLTNSDYNYTIDKINYSHNINGIHFMFLTLWPDSAERIWMQKDLDTVAPTTPVIIFTHDEPTSESKHFTNPLPPHNMTVKNKFQNLVEEDYKEGYVAGKGEDATNEEQRGFVNFLKSHPNIKAYFHGNTNYNQFYTYTGPDNNVKLPVFRVDSPMKGEHSAKDETLLSFQLISINTQKQILTVRECLWNTKPMDAHQQIVFGKSVTLDFKIKK